MPERTLTAMRSGQPNTHTARVIRIVYEKRRNMPKYVVLYKYAELVHRDPHSVMRMLKAGRIAGARKVTRRGILTWAIPEDAPWPDNLRWANVIEDDINDFIPK